MSSVLWLFLEQHVWEGEVWGETEGLPVKFTAIESKVPVLSTLKVTGTGFNRMQRKIFWIPLASGLDLNVLGLY